MIGINTGERSDPLNKAREFRDEHRLTYPILLDADGRAADAFRVRAFPTNIIIDREGVVRYAGSGFDTDAIDRTLAELAAG